MRLGAGFGHRYRPLLMRLRHFFGEMSHVFLLHCHNLRQLLLVWIFSLGWRRPFILVHLSHQFLNFWNERSFILLILIYLLDIPSCFTRFWSIVIPRRHLPCGSRCNILRFRMSQVLLACFCNIYSRIASLRLELFFNGGLLWANRVLINTWSIESKFVINFGGRLCILVWISLGASTSVPCPVNVRIGSSPTSFSWLWFSSAS